MKARVFVLKNAFLIACLLSSSQVFAQYSYDSVARNTIWLSVGVGTVSAVSGLNFGFYNLGYEYRVAKRLNIELELGANYVNTFPEEINFRCNDPVDFSCEIFDIPQEVYDLWIGEGVEVGYSQAFNNYSFQSIMVNVKYDFINKVNVKWGVFSGIGYSTMSNLNLSAVQFSSSGGIITDAELKYFFNYQKNISANVIGVYHNRIFANGMVVGLRAKLLAEIGTLNNEVVWGVSPDSFLSASIVIGKKF